MNPLATADTHVSARERPRWVNGSRTKPPRGGCARGPPKAEISTRSYDPVGLPDDAQPTHPYLLDPLPHVPTGYTCQAAVRGGRAGEMTNQQGRREHRDESGTTRDRLGPRHNSAPRKQRDPTPAEGATDSPDRRQAARRKRGAGAGARKALREA